MPISVYLRASPYMHHYILEFEQSALVNRKTVQVIFSFRFISAAAMHWSWHSTLISPDGPEHNLACKQICKINIKSVTTRRKSAHLQHKATLQTPVHRLRLKCELYCDLKR